jgi:hypothetical protein
MSLTANYKVSIRMGKTQNKQSKLIGLYSVSELYRPSDRRLSTKLVPTLADRGCHVVSVKDPYSRNLGFLI